MRRSRRHGAAVASRTGDFAALPSELVHIIASALGDKDRWAMMGTCKGWFAAIEASPDLWPVFTVKLRSGIVGEQLSQLASLGSAVWHVRLQDHLMLSGSEPLLAPAVLLSLPRAVRVLEIGIPCGGPALEALLHCEQLRKLTITGNAAKALWGGHAAPAVLPKLRSLRLDYRRKPGGMLFADRVPSSALALQAASQLTHLTLSGLWDDNLGALCLSLPALRSLSRLI